MRTDPEPLLLDRDEELARISALIEEAGSGSGRLLLVEGSPGIGKTQLLRYARVAARHRGMQVRTARGAELERDFPFGVVRQLLERAIAATGPDEGAALFQGAAALARQVLAPEQPPETGYDGFPKPGGEATFAALHGLFWLCVNLAEARPLFLCVDDAHWADSPSLRFFSYLVGRLEGLPVLMALAARPAEPGAELLGELAGERQVETLRLRPLSEAAVARIVEASFSETVDEAFSRACHAATGGNPFLLGELLSALRAEGIAPTAASAGKVATLGPKTVARTVLRRLKSLPSGALKLARAVAVLGPEAELRHAAAVAGLAQEVAGRAADGLAAAEILRPGRPLDFVHPIVRAATYEDLPPVERALAHQRAARLLDEEGLGKDRVAAHLLVAEPGGEDWVVETLRRAAREAIIRGAAASACSYLRRALAEPPQGPARRAVLYELGQAEMGIDPEAAAEHLTSAYQSSEHPRERASVALELLQALLQTGEVDEAVELVNSSVAALGAADEELALRLEAELTTVLRQAVATSPLAEARLSRWMGRVEGRSPAERLIVAHLAVYAALTGSEAGVVADLAERALGGGLLLEEQSPNSVLFYLPLYPLMCADRFEPVGRHLEAALEEARRRGSSVAFVLASVFRSQLACALGKLGEAEAEARGAMETAARLPGWRFGLPGALEALVQVLVEREELKEAEERLRENGFDKELPDTVPFRLLLAARGRLRLAQGRAQEALDDLLELMGREKQKGAANLFLRPYRPQAALALSMLGRPTGRHA